MQKRSGQSLSQYVLVAALVAVVCIPALGLLGTSVNENVLNMLPARSTGKSAALQTVSRDGSAGNIIIPNTWSSSNSGIVIPEQQSSIQVSGSNGGMEKINGNATAMLELSAQYAQTDPQVSNVLIELGRLGQNMAQSMTTGNKNDVVQTWDKFISFYSKDVFESGVFNQLSAQDQALVKALTNQSAQLSSNVVGEIGYSNYPGLDNYIAPPNNGTTADSDGANQVNDNSSQTKQCGENLQCN